MDERTREHLQTAQANREYALAILLDEDATTTQLNWAAVAAFYAAMHAINAYLWELARLEPANHRECLDIVLRWPALQPALASYDTLLTFSIRARNEPGYAMRQSRLNLLINRNLNRVITTIEGALPDDDQPHAQITKTRRQNRRVSVFDGVCPSGCRAPSRSQPRWR